MADERVPARRTYSAEHKALILEQCNAPGASVAAVALSHGVNANVVHRWRRLARMDAGAAAVSSREFVPVAMEAPVARAGEDIRIELRRGATSVTLAWPTSAAGDCALWLRELLR